MAPLTTTNLITILASTVFVVGWFVNGFIQRRHEIAKERFRFRMEMLKESLELLNNIKTLAPEKLVGFFTSMEFKAQLKKIDILFYLYGNENEILEWQAISNTIKSNNFNKINSYIDSLIETLRFSVRKELRLKIS